ncbi:MAG: hypothetical protein ACQCN3_02100 [Candidatus Bathyarchaeia archaeon]|jgi:cell division protein FtsL
MTETNNDKVVSKNVAVALGVICIVLATSLVVAVANGLVFSDQQSLSDLEDQVATQATQISSLTAQATILRNQLSSLNSSVSDYEAQIAELTDENGYYGSIVGINASAVILDTQTYTQDANNTTSLLNEALGYAGYIEVQVESSSNTTYVQTTYTYNSLSYNQRVTVGTNGTAYFPVLPSIVEIILGNTATETNNATVTLTYYY